MEKYRSEETDTGFFPLSAPVSATVNIITVTLNPVLDKTLWVSRFTPGTTFLADHSATYAGGKGMNVSRALKRIGMQSTATGIGGTDGIDSYLRIVRTEGITHDFVRTEGRLRMNITIVTDDNREETHIRERGPELGPSCLDKLVKKLQSLVRDTGDRETIVVLAGSLPRGISPDVYGDLTKLLKKRGVAVCLDTSGPPLKKGLEAGPSLIKPNLAEVEDALGFMPLNEKQIVEAVRRFHASGIQRVMITMGGEGLIFSEGVEIVRAKLAIDRPVSTVGSGDAALAGAVSGMANGFDTGKTAVLSCALGGANTLCAGACIFDPGVVEELREETAVETIGRV